VTVAGVPATLRGKARQLGVSHEAVRQAIRRAGQPTDLASRNAERNARVRALGVQGVPWAEIASRFGVSPSLVRLICKDLPQRAGGPRRRGRPPDSAAHRGEAQLHVSPS
jgi:hypothetical protein